MKKVLNLFYKNIKQDELIRGCNFIFDSVDILYYNLNKISLVRGVTCMDTPECLKDQTATINPKNKDYKCFQYSLAVVLNHKRIKSYPERISNFKPFCNK